MATRRAKSFVMRTNHSGLAGEVMSLKCATRMGANGLASERRYLPLSGTVTKAIALAHAVFNSFMPKSRLTFLAVLTASLTSAVGSYGSENSYLLSYREPATQWVAALPVGNGRLGAMVFGGPT